MYSGLVPQSEFDSVAYANLVVDGAHVVPGDVCAVRTCGWADERGEVCVKLRDHGYYSLVSVKGVSENV